MTAVEPALFPEPEHVPPLADGWWQVGPAPHRWRYTLLGEDSEWLVVDGHAIRLVEVAELVRAADVLGWTDDPVEWGSATRKTWAQLLHFCDHHLTFVDDCNTCAVFRSGEGPVWQWTARADPDDADRGKPGWFPVTVVDLEG